MIAPTHFFMERFSSLEAMDCYVKALEEEKKKILVFERELPLSLELVIHAIGSCIANTSSSFMLHNQHGLVIHAIESCRKQLEEQQKHVGGEELSSEGPALEEFIPLRPGNSSDWLRTVQLWKEPDPPEGGVLRRPTATRATRVGTGGGAFHPFQREKNVKGGSPASSTTETNGGEEKEGQPAQRKMRRCWSPELHRHFLHALEQLGGSHAATPRQIRELMKVDGLTNDEVKSHLQKYRLHTKRPSPSSVQSSGRSSAHTAHFVLVGGLWMPPTEYTAAFASQPTQDTAGAPLKATLADQHLHKSKQPPKRSPTGPLNSEGRCGGDDNSEDGDHRINSDSSVTASSPRMTTASRSSSRRR